MTAKLPKRKQRLSVDRLQARFEALAEENAQLRQRVEELADAQPEPTVELPEGRYADANGDVWKAALSVYASDVHCGKVIEGEFIAGVPKGSVTLTDGAVVSTASGKEIGDIRGGRYVARASVSGYPDPVELARRRAERERQEQAELDELRRSGKPWQDPMGIWRTGMDGQQLRGPLPESAAATAARRERERQQQEQHEHLAAMGVPAGARIEGADVTLAGNLIGHIRSGRFVPAKRGGDFDHRHAPEAREAGND